MKSKTKVVMKYVLYAVILIALLCGLNYGLNYNKNHGLGDPVNFDMNIVVDGEVVNWDLAVLSW